MECLCLPYHGGGGREHGHRPGMELPSPSPACLEVGHRKPWFPVPGILSYLSNAVTEAATLVQSEAREVGNAGFQLQRMVSLKVHPTQSSEAGGEDAGLASGCGLMAHVCHSLA